MLPIVTRQISSIKGGLQIKHPPGKAPAQEGQCVCCKHDGHRNRQPKIDTWVEEICNMKNPNVTAVVHRLVSESNIHKIEEMERKSFRSDAKDQFV